MAPYVSTPGHGHARSSSDSDDEPSPLDASSSAHVYPPAQGPSAAVAALRNVQDKDDRDLEAMIPSGHPQSRISFGRGELVMIFASMTAVSVLALTAATLTVKKVSW